MRTRRGNSYPVAGAPVTTHRKKKKSSNVLCNTFDVLSDDVVLTILAKLASDADCAADFVPTLLTCKRLNGLGLDSVVLSKASLEMFTVKASSWTESVKRFMRRCADAGNVEACYTLGMIEFYCFHNWRTGAALMAKAAIRSHAPALYSLAIIQFNGSGSFKNMKDLTGGVTLCARAAFFNHIDALRELGHCLIDGYGINKNPMEGHRFLLEANKRELIAKYCPTPLKCHLANRFLVDWYANQQQDHLYRICCYVGCGRTETRMHEFRRCSVCGVKNYCSRGCQARDWTMGHSMDCRMLRFPVINAGGR